MRMFFRNAALLLAIAATVCGCGSADPREVYRGSEAEALMAIVKEIEGAKRSVLAKSAALPREAIAGALAAARERGVLVEFVVCANPAAVLDENSRPPEALPIAFDPTGPSAQRSSLRDRHADSRADLVPDEPGR